MAKKKTIVGGPVPAMLKALERFQNHSGEWFSDLFKRFLNHCMHCFSHGAIGKAEEEEIFTELLQLLGEAAPFEDVLGPLYEGINSRYKASAMGQFFTPNPVARFMAQIVIDPYQAKDQNLNFMEPTCGSGALILAAAEVVADSRQQHLWWAADLDLMCVKMCTIQCALHSIPAFVCHMNSLSNEVFGGYAVELLRMPTGMLLPRVVELKGEALERVTAAISGGLKQHAEKQPPQPLQEQPTTEPIPTPVEQPKPPTKPRRGVDPNQPSLF